MNKIITHSRQEDKYSPYINAIWEVIGIFMSKSNVSYQNIEEYLELLDLDLLSDTPRVFLIEDKKREVASDKEKYFSLKSKVLLKLGKYKECIELCQRALSEIKVFHHDNDIWLRYREGIANFKLGKMDVAERIIYEILPYKEHWILYATLFAINKEKKENQKALKNASMAFLIKGEHKHKIKLYENISDLLFEMGLEKESYYHLLLIRDIKEENGWNISSTFQKKMNTRIKVEEEINNKELLRRLEDFWYEYRFEGETLHSGKIKTILKNKKAGFIEDNLKRSYFFRMTAIKDRKNVEIGAKVKFYTKQSYDRVKEVISTEAIEIRVIA